MRHLFQMTQHYVTQVLLSKAEVKSNIAVYSKLLACFNKQHFPQALDYCALNMKARKMSQAHGQVEGSGAERTEWCIYF